MFDVDATGGLLISVEDAASRSPREVLLLEADARMVLDRQEAGRARGGKEGTG